MFVYTANGPQFFSNDLYTDRVTCIIIMHYDLYKYLGSPPNAPHPQLPVATAMLLPLGVG